MARKLNEIQLMLDGQDFMKQFVSDLRKDVKGLGGDDAMTYCAIKSDSKLRKDFAKLIVAGGSVAKRLALKSLKLVKDGIVITTEPLSKNSFFMENGPMKLYFWDNFRNWVLSAVPETVAAFRGALLKTQLTKDMRDPEILDELGNPKPFTVGEFAAIIRNLLMKQPNGEEGDLPTNGHAIIFYVQLEGRVVAVLVRWRSCFHVWYLDADGFGGGQWRDGCCVFSSS